MGFTVTEAKATTAAYQELRNSDLTNGWSETQIETLARSIGIKAAELLQEWEDSKHAEFKQERSLEIRPFRVTDGGKIDDRSVA